jgi:hypothetical protein
METAGAVPPQEDIVRATYVSCMLSHVAALAGGSPEEREAAYCSIERGTTVSTAAASGGGDGGSVGEADKGQAVALAVACVKPLFEAVLCAPASKVGEAEFIRCSLLLHDMQKLDVLAVCGELWRKNADGIPLYVTAWTARDTVFAAMLAKEPIDFDRNDAIIAAAAQSNWGLNVANTAGISATCAAAGIADMAWVEMCVAYHPFWGERGQRNLPLALLCLELVRSEADTQPEAIIAGAWRVLCDSNTNPKGAQVLFAAGFVDVAQAALQRWNPIGRISKQNIVPSAILTALKDCSHSAASEGTEIIQPLLDAGVVDIVISTLTAYQMLGPEHASVVAVEFGALEMIQVLVSSPEQAKPIAAKLRSAGVDSFRYILDHPLVCLTTLCETGPAATRKA